MPSHYELLGVSPTASTNEIKAAFRREVARYHPDKVQHLGSEFQAIAASKTSELTNAYKILSDDASRREYDQRLGASAPADGGGDAGHGPGPAARGATARRDGGAEPAPGWGARPAASRTPTGANDLVWKATVARFRRAVDQEFGHCPQASVHGFDVDCSPPKRGMFRRRTPPRILARFVPQVDGEAVHETWAMATRARESDQRELCVFVLGPVVAAPVVLGRAIAERRRTPGPAAPLVMVPVNTRSWAAHVPNDAPPEVRQLLARLRAG